MTKANTMIKYTAKITPAIKLFSPSIIVTIIPAIVAPNIGISEIMNAIAADGSAKLLGTSGKNIEIINTVRPARIPPTPDTASWPFT